MLPAPAWFSPLLLVAALTTPVARQPQVVTVGLNASVQAAINAVPNGTAATVRLQPGRYHEVVTVPAGKTHLTLTGTTGNPADVVIDFDNASGTPKPGGGTYGTSGSATVAITANDFTARDLTFSNSFNRTAHPEIKDTQAVAVKATGDRALFDNVRFLGHQDTLLADTPATTTRSRQYYRDCYIAGDVDFIFGRATAVFDHTTIDALNRGSNPNGYLTAASTQRSNPYGFLIISSTVTSSAASRSEYLGRPWHPGGDVNAIAQVVFRNTYLPAAIKTTPWTDMSGFSWRDARLREYQNTGPGAGTGTDRPQLTAAEAATYTVANYLGDWRP
ncbi:pectinesterase family protein [Kibdelosporangium lantanae]